MEFAVLAQQYRAQWAKENKPPPPKTESELLAERLGLRSWHGEVPQPPGDAFATERRFLEEARQAGQSQEQVVPDDLSVISGLIPPKGGLAALVSKRIDETLEEHSSHSNVAGTQQESAPEALNEPSMEDVTTQRGRTKSAGEKSEAYGDEGFEDDQHESAQPKATKRKSEAYGDEVFEEDDNQPTQTENKVSDDNGYEEDAFEDSSTSPNDADANAPPVNQPAVPTSDAATASTPAGEATDVPAAETTDVPVNASADGQA